MFMDDAVFAGMATVALMVAFLVGVGIFVYRDARKHHLARQEEKKPLN